MRVSKRMAIALITVVFLAGFTLGHLSLKPSHAEGFPGARAFRLAQIGPLIDQMQKNIDELQQKLKALREVKDVLVADEKIEIIPQLPVKPLK
jgi:hypothetical protein